MKVLRIGVQLVLTTSSKTVGARSMTRARRAPRELVVCAHDRVEARQVLVETEHVRDCRRQRIPYSRGSGSCDKIDLQLSPRLCEPKGAGSAGNRERCLERPSREIDPVGRQFCDAVRDNSAGELDRFAARSPKQKVCDAHTVSFPKRRPRRRRGESRHFSISISSVRRVVG